MATSAAAKRKNLVFGGLFFIVVAAVVVRADRSSSSPSVAHRENDGVETQMDKKEAPQEQDTEIGCLDDGDNTPGSKEVSREVNEIDQLLSQSVATNDALDKENSKVKAWKYATYGGLATAGLGGLLGLSKAIYNIKKGGEQTKKGGALNMIFAGLVLAGAAGLAASLVKKAQAEKRLKEQARDLLGQRQAMLAKLSQLKDSQLEKVLNKAEEIGNVASDLGLYAPAIESAVPVDDMEVGGDGKN